MNEEDDKIAGIAAASLVAIEALNNALEKAGIIPEGLVVRAIRETLNPKDPEGGFNEGAGIVIDFMETRNVAIGRPKWLRGVTNGGKTGLDKK